MIERLPERVRTPAVARAVVSPSALLLAGAGMAGAILGGLPLAAAAGVGALAWAARVAFAVPRRPAGERVDPFRVGEPWRRFVQDALQARDRFERTVRRMRPGPLQERLATVERRVAEGVQECWRIARHGDALIDALREIDVDDAQRDLDELEEARSRAGRDGRRAESMDRAVEAVEAQLQSARRIDSVARDAVDRLRVLTAQLDEAVARAVELSVRAHDVGELEPLTDDVDNLVGELEALRQGLEETGGTAAQATG
jgi:hypothetical protein